MHIQLIWMKWEAKQIDKDVLQEHGVHRLVSTDKSYQD